MHTNKLHTYKHYPLQQHCTHIRIIPHCSNATQAASLLLEAGADVNSKNIKRGITPIMIAGAVGHFELLEIMATHYKADVNVQVCIIYIHSTIYFKNKERKTHTHHCGCLLTIHYMYVHSVSAEKSSSPLSKFSSTLQLLSPEESKPSLFSLLQDLQGQTALHHVLSSQRTRAIPILMAAGASLTLINSNCFSPLMEAAGHGSLP